MNRFLVVVMAGMILLGCSKFPVDEDGLLITNNSDCYVSNFDLLNPSEVSVKVNNANIDNINGRIEVDVLFGTNTKKLWPVFSLATDCKLEPKITGWEDFSDTENNPKQYTVISGNRKVRKTYSVRVTVLNP